MRPILTAALMLLAWAGLAQAQEKVVRLAVTTSFHNSGLAEVLLPEIRRDLGLTVQLLVVGTGQALRLGQAGDVDAVLVHSRAAEEEFVAQGWGTHRREIMYNDFVLIGPEDDPAGVAGAAGAAEALQRIATAGAPFVSRGDDSGTHRRERALWQAAGIDPLHASGRWYREAGAGMGAALNIAAGMGAYVLSDRATWLNFGHKDGLRILFEGDPALFNQYAFIPVNPERHGHVKADLVAALEAWLTSEKGQRLIGVYEIDGQKLFVPNAAQEGSDG
ncbi:tungstate transport system substrate-binding protein [Meinhardsimonia xiamenensis]|jgi:tungstate transport system substrate-binding protein|uniref:Tungstate transport system substrate-binding protein n=1 Tax=Meinhardsimonia xiamenensis TaxID=990712 RepID=A0A1G9F504_9RHOB|nr:substrate-binding domain-containing protein [Meinhardsimonia xiamenensis]PRX37992.1 tungstate transport system substrate-binding protein [Meinhardsimonia xiamenensis]SDK83448.1 tungstate transport system substrate-binding protein [Meinhardsimonia xiamenensis]